MGGLKELLELVATQVAIAKNLGEQSRPKSFAGMDWHYCRTAIGVIKKMVAAFDAEYFKTSLLQDRQ